MDRPPPTPPSDPRGHEPRPDPDVDRPRRPLDPDPGGGETHSDAAPDQDQSPSGQTSPGAQEAPPAPVNDLDLAGSPPPRDPQPSDPRGLPYPYPYGPDPHSYQPPQPYGYQPPYPPGYPYAPADQGAPWAGAAAGWGEPPASRDQTVFGVGPRSRPGRVPWGGLQVLQALLIAAGPIVALVILAYFLPQQDAASPEVSAAAAAFAVVFTILIDGWFTLWAWMFSLRRGRLSATSWGLRRVGKTIFWLVPVALVGIFILNAGYQALFQALAGHPTPEQSVVEMFPRSSAGLLLFILLAVVAAPFFEEVVFRGFIFQGLASSWGTIPGVIVSAALFGAVHAQLTVFVPLFILGAVLAWVFYYTRSLWTSIALHATFNAVAVLVWALSS